MQWAYCRLLKGIDSKSLMCGCRQQHLIKNFFFFFFFKPWRLQMRVSVVQKLCRTLGMPETFEGIAKWSSTGKATHNRSASKKKSQGKCALSWAIAKSRNCTQKRNRPRIKKKKPKKYEINKKFVNFLTTNFIGSTRTCSNPPQKKVNA